MTTLFDYPKVFDLEPPQFYEQKEISDETFAKGDLRAVNMALLNNDWRLTPIEDSSPGDDHRDPLDGLTRMGLVDLVNHDENEDVTLVLPSNQSKKLINKIRSCGHPMRRKNTEQLWVVKNAKVKKIDKDRVQSLSGRLELRANNNISFMIDLPNFRDLKEKKGKGNKCNKKIEIWKKLPYKAKQVSDFLLCNLRTMRKDAWQMNGMKRNAIVSFLLGESRGDVLMSFAIVNAYSRIRFTVAEHALKEATIKLDRIQAKQKKPSYYDQKPAKRTRTGRENNNLEQNQGESNQIDKTD